jgi:biopolymer transport protein ExbB
MAGDNIQLAQNTAVEGAAPADPAAAPVDPMAAPPADAGLPPMDAAVPMDSAPPVDAAPLDAGAEGSLGDATTAENPYGLAALWGQGDFVARGTLIILVLMSLYSWFIILTKLWEQAQLLKQAKQASKDFWTGRTLAESVEKLTGKGNAFRAIAESGIKASEHHEGKLTDKVPLADWIAGNLQRNRDRMNNDLQRGLSFLASVGSTAPFVGLFGTVWGIYHALIAIGVAGQASIDKVAGPVGEALIMTAIGLAVAVPAVLGYNWLLRRNKAILDQLRYFTDDLYATLVSGASRK